MSTNHSEPVSLRQALDAYYDHLRLDNSPADAAFLYLHAGIGRHRPQAVAGPGGARRADGSVCHFQLTKTDYTPRNKEQS